MATINARFQFTAFILLVVTGCATFKPDIGYQDLMKEHRPTVTESNNGMELSLEEFVSSEKSRKIFDTDVASHQVLAIFLRATNRGPGNYKVWGTEATALLGDQSLPLLRGVDAADLAATRDTVGKATGWALATGPLFLFFGPMAIAGSGSHSSYVNQDIEHHFENLEFGNALLRASQLIGGFLFFKLPKTIERTENVTIEIPVSEENSTVRTGFRFILPIRESRMSALQYKTA
jgi:hypothetical protein